MSLQSPPITITPPTHYTGGTPIPPNSIHSYVVEVKGPSDPDFVIVGPSHFAGDEVFDLVGKYNIAVAGDYEVRVAARIVVTGNLSAPSNVLIRSVVDTTDDVPNPPVIS